MRISDILRHKGSSVVTVGPDVTVPELLATLNDRNVGALVVVEDGQVVGIVSERDVVRHLHSEGASVLEGPIRAIMTTNVVTCEPTDSVDETAAVMTERRIRHMPVVHQGSLSGIVTIGDVVSSRIRQLEENSRQLEQYITG